MSSSSSDGVDERLNEAFEEMFDQQFDHAFESVFDVQAKKLKRREEVPKLIFRTLRTSFPISVICLAFAIKFGINRYMLVCKLI